RDANGYYPKLSSGSYVPNTTVSVWPSWQDAFGQALGITVPTDPINALGDCGGDSYNRTTCWDESAKKFADPDPSDGNFGLPAGSSAYVYAASSDGSDYGLNMGFETGDLTDSGFSYTGSGSGGVSGSVGNQAPSFTGSNLPDGNTANKYSGYIEAKDPEGAALSWKISALKYEGDSSSVSWEASSSSETIVQFLENSLLWEGANILAKTEVSTQKKISATKLGKGGAYTMTVEIDDGKGGSNSKVSKNFSFNIKNIAPIVKAIDKQEVVIGKKLDFSISASDEDSHYPLTFSFNYPDNPDSPPVSFSCYEITETSGSYKYSCHIVIDSVVAGTKEYTFEAKAIDAYGKESEAESFIVSVKNNAPEITATSISDAMACADNSIQFSAADPDGHSMTYSAKDLPSGLSMDSAGKITGKPTAKGAYSPSVTVRDEYYGKTISPYSAETTKQLAMNVADEVFTVSVSVNPQSASTIYIYPSGASSVYYGPVQYSAQASSSSNNKMTYSLSGNPDWLQINSGTGEVQGTPTSASDVGSYTVTITAKNSCGASSSADFSITVKNNIWCGDNIVNGTTKYTESCDGGSGACTVNNYNGTKSCNSSCSWNSCVATEYCGDKVVNGNEQCEAAGGGTSIYDQYNCSACKWTGGFCGDKIKNGNEQCDGGKSCKNCQYNCPTGTTLALYNGAYYCQKTAYTWTQTVDHSVDIHFYSDGTISYSNECCHQYYSYEEYPGAGMQYTMSNWYDYNYTPVGMSVAKGYPTTYDSSTMFPYSGSVVYDLDVSGTGSCQLNGNITAGASEIIIPIYEPAADEHSCTASIQQYIPL
ncbi:MAG: putative Ig domain-containing protein, partial [Patescibacteria group bacterium]